MREKEFRLFLEHNPDISSKKKAVNTRISKGNSVEEKYSISLDSIVSDDVLMYKNLLKINEDFNNKNGGYSNALRKYYLFINGKEFPQLNDYKNQLFAMIKNLAKN